MCGISGYTSTTNGPYTSKVIKQLLMDIEPRGHDATGIAYLVGKQFKVAKAPGVASSFLKRAEFTDNEETIANSKIVLLHTRAASHGSPSKAQNNHPIWNERGIMIHNGVVSTPLKLAAAKGETDTEQMMLHIQKAGFAGINDLKGWLAIAYFDFAEQKLFLYHKDAPLFILKTPDTIVWSSTASSLEKMDLGKVEELPVGHVFSIANGSIELVDMGEFAPKCYSRFEVTSIQKTAPASAQDGIAKRTAGFMKKLVGGTGFGDNEDGYAQSAVSAKERVKALGNSAAIKGIRSLDWWTVRMDIFSAFYDRFETAASSEETHLLEALAQRVLENNTYSYNNEKRSRQANAKSSVVESPWKKVKKNEVRHKHSEVVTISSSDENWRSMLASFREEDRAEKAECIHGIPPLEMNDRNKAVEAKALKDWQNGN